MPATYLTRRAAVVLACGSLAGCGTVIRGTSQRVELRSTPSDATVTVRDETNTEVFSGTTPAEVRLRKRKGYFSGKDYVVTVEKPGYAPFTLQLNRRVSAWYVAGNFVIGGLIGWLIVDPLTGGMWVYDPGEVDANLSQSVADAGDDALRLNVVLLEDVPADVRAGMRPLRQG